MISKDRIKALLERYIAGTISPQGFDELHGYLLGGEEDESLAAVMKTMLEEMELDDALPVDSDRIYEQIVNHEQFSVNPDHTILTPRGRGLRRWLTAAAALLAVAIGVFFVRNDARSPSLATQQQEADDGIYSNDSIEHPTLLLADGTTVNLDSVAAGLLAMQGETRVEFNGDELVYNDKAGEVADAAPLTNKVIIPKGKQYQIMLPDGTRVWLNTATSLTYPVRFVGNKRIVEVEGEAYFDVVHDDRMPFVVKSGEHEVSVLGTSFNVSSYGDDAMIKTTLVEGKVQINTPPSSSAILRPGEQSVVTKGDSRIHVRNIDTDEVISWKRGLFVFNDEAIAEVMKKVSRWYDVEVVFEDDMAGKLIGGTIPRFSDIDKLMDALQATGLLHYKMEGGKIVIMK